MKKTSAFIGVLALCCCALTGCGDSSADRAVCTAIVENVSGAEMTVKPVEGSAELSSSDEFRVAFGDFDISPNSGDTVEITYSGGVLETDPASFGNVTSVEIID